MGNNGKVLPKFTDCFVYIVQGPRAESDTTWIEIKELDSLENGYTLGKR